MSDIIVASCPPSGLYFHRLLRLFEEESLPLTTRFFVQSTSTGLFSPIISIAYRDITNTLLANHIPAPFPPMPAIDNRAIILNIS